MKKLIFILFCISASSTHLIDVCNSYNNSCHECIQVPGCAWNFDIDFKNGSRCLSARNAESNENLYNPSNSLTIIQNKLIDEEVQISPQKAKIKFRIQEPIYLQISLKNNNSSVSVLLSSFENILVGFPLVQKSSKVMVRIVATGCPKDPKKFKQVVPVIQDQSGQRLTIDVEIICSCSCEERNSRWCSGSGYFKCGLCECDQGTYGKRCECRGTATSDSCTNNGVECSGRGACVCQNCDCEQRPNRNEIIYGKFCECDNFTCARFNGLICGGSDRGDCNCSRCQCRPGFTGESCNISQ